MWYRSLVDYFQKPRFAISPIQITFRNLLVIASFILVGVLFVYYPYYIMGLSIILAVIAIMYSRPIIGLYLLIFIMPVRTINIIMDSPIRHLNEVINLFFIPATILFSIFVFRHIIVKDKLSKNELNTLMILLGGWAFISLFWTLDIYHGVYVSVSFLSCIFTLYLFQSLLTSKTQIKNILNFSLFVGLIAAILTTVSYWYHGSKEMKLFDDAVLSMVLNNESNRPGGLSPVNHTSNILNNFIFMGIALLYRANLWKRALISLIIFFHMFNVFFTGSKGGAGSLIIGLFFLIFFATPLRKKAFSWTVLTSIILFITLITVSFISGKGFLQARATSTGGAFSIETRLRWWGKGFEYLWGSGGLGLGVGGFSKILDPEAPAAHSFLFSLLFDLGVIGAAIFGCIFLKILFLAKSTIQKSKDRELAFIAMCLISALVAFFIHGLVDMDYIYQPFWVVLGLLLSISNINKCVLKNHIDLKMGL